MKPDEEEVEQDLRENDLVNWFQVGLPLFLRKNGSYLLLAAALCLLAYQLYNRYEAKKQTEVQNAWTELNEYSAPNFENAPTRLESLIAQYQIKTVQANAYVALAAFYLEDVAHGNPPTGYRGVKVSRDAALAKAEEAANKIISDFPENTVPVGKAHLALAAVALNRNDYSGARKQYEFLTDKSGRFADTAFAQIADAQLKNFDAFQKVPPLASLAPPEPPPAPPATIPSDMNSTLSPMPAPTGLSLPDLGPTIPTIPAAPATSQP